MSRRAFGTRMAFPEGLVQRVELLNFGVSYLEENVVETPSLGGED